MLMMTNKAKTALHGYHCLGDMAVRMRKVQARPWVGVRVCHLLSLLFHIMGSGSFYGCLIETKGVSVRLKETAQTPVFLLSPSLLLNHLKLHSSKPNSYHP